MAKPGILHQTKWKASVRDFEKIGKGPAELIGSLELMWMASHSTGSYEFSSKEDIEAACCWKGEDGVLADILIARRWIDQKGELYVIHDYEDHKPGYVLKREYDKEYSKKNRQRQKITTDSRQPSSLVVNSRNESSPFPSLPLRESSNKELSLLRQNPETPVPETACAPAVPSGAVAPGTARAAIVLPCENDTHTYAITDKRLAELRTQFPDVDVPAQLQSLAQWLTNYPDRQPPAKSMPAYVANCLRRAVKPPPEKKHGPGYNPVIAELLRTGGVEIRHN